VKLASEASSPLNGAELDFGLNDDELLISYNNSDLNLHFNTQNERDETVCIILQVCKHIVRNDITVSYSIHIDQRKGH